MEEGAAPAIDRDLLDVELRRSRAERLVTVGRTDAAVITLNRVLGLPPDAPLRVRHRLAEVVAQEPGIEKTTAPIGGGRGLSMWATSARRGARGEPM